ncbi:hypothetical protein GALL_538290 [mine drainage metagenome]|uniref:Uncharacterized protein n=1 Tax=mine drainage metagenome TaxID=410659 RepID=A0A1J5PAX9_9ZZZZ
MMTSYAEPVVPFTIAAFSPPGTVPAGLVDVVTSAQFDPDPQEPPDEPIQEYSSAILASQDSVNFPSKWKSKKGGKATIFQSDILLVL